MIWLIKNLKDLGMKPVSDKHLRDKPFTIAKNPKYDRYQRGLTLMIYKFFDKKLTGDGIKNQIAQDQQLAEELNKPVIRKFK